MPIWLWGTFDDDLGFKGAQTTMVIGAHMGNIPGHGKIFCLETEISLASRLGGQ